MASNETSSVPARLKDLKDSVKERFLGLLGLRQPKVLLEDEQEVYLQVGRTVWHAPRQLRIELWLSSLARRHSLVSEYQTYLSQEIAREASVDIDKDVQRTFPNTRRFHAEEGQTQLRNVLRAYAAYDPEVAYCQGMNFLTGLLLMYLPTEAHAFAALVVLMEDRRLRSFYHRSMSLLQVQLWQLSRLISPSLNQHLEALGVVPMLYGASWLMTVFSADFPIPFSARIMDVLLADQCECALLKVAAAIMKAVEQRLHAMVDLEDVLGYLKIEVPAWEEDDLYDVLTAAFTKPWTARQLSVLRSTEGAETVAQAMDRVMTMNEQQPVSVHGGDDEEPVEDAEVADARVAVTIPRLQPPPQPPNSFSASPACGTPISGGIGVLFGSRSLDSASGGGAAPAAGAGGSSPPPNGAPVKCASLGSATGGAGGSGGSGSGSGGMLLLQGAAAAAGSPAVWGIPSIHPNVAASPAIQAFRRAHLPNLQAAVSSDGHSSLPSHHHGPHGRLSRSSMPSDLGAHLGTHFEETLQEAAEGAVAAAASKSTLAPAQSLPLPPLELPDIPDLDSEQQSVFEGCSTEEWGEFSAAVARQHWRSLARSAAGSMRRDPLEHAVGDEAGGNGSGAVQEALGSDPAGDQQQQLRQSQEQPGSVPSQPPPTPQEPWMSGPSIFGPSQPIPVPGAGSSGGSRSGSSGGGAGISAFSAAAGVGIGQAATACGRPPLPPRGASFERGHQLGSSGSRLSVVAEDPPSVLMGPAAPAPSPRGSIDLHMLGRSGSHQLQLNLDHCGEHLGNMLYRSASVAAAGGSISGGGAGSVDYASGTASAATGGVPLSPSGVSGPVSPHAMSPRVMSAWSASAGHGSGGGADTPTAGYVPLGIVASTMDRAVSGSLLESAPGALAFSGGSISAAAPPPLAAVSGVAEEQKVPLLPPPPSATLHPQPLQPSQPSADMATDIAGDILRMLTAVDTGNARVGYDSRAVLGESMYAESPKEQLELVRHELSRNPPSANIAADLQVAQDLAKAQEEAELMRQELDAQLQLQRIASQSASAASVTGAAAAVMAAAVAAAADAAAAAAIAIAGCSAAEAAASSMIAEHVNEEVAHTAAETTVTTAAAPVVPLETAEVVASSTAAEDHPSAPAAPASGATASAVAASATAGTGSVTTAGASEEFVLKRPMLYVDGIPMFDPKSLMADAHEAQVMFTPTVSPGASSFAESLPAVATPNCEVTPATEEPTATSSAQGVVSTLSPVEAEAAETPYEAVDAAEEEATAATVTSAAPTSDGFATEEAPVAAEPSASQLVEATTSSGGESGGGSTAEAVPPALPPRLTLPHSPSASEWVDWSQAPPILTPQAVLSTAAPSPESGPVAGAAGSAVTAASPDAPPAQTAGTTASPPPAPAACEIADAGGMLPQAVLIPDLNLIDMASPATIPAQQAAPSQEGENLTVAPHVEVTAPPQLQRQQPQHREPSLASMDSVHEPDASAIGQHMPYGLLPAGSTALPSACLSMANSNVDAVTAAAGGGNFMNYLFTQLRGEPSTGFSNGGASTGRRATANDMGASDTDGDTPRSVDGVGHPMPFRATMHTYGGGRPLSKLGHTVSMPAPAADVDASACEVSAEEGSMGGVEPPVLAMEHSLSPSAAAMQDGDARQEAEAAPQEALAMGTEVAAEATGMKLRLSAAGAEGGAEEADGASTPVAQQERVDAEGPEGEEGDSSPFRAALSPSLAHHIMSAYLRSAQHQQEQEQRELEERMHQQLQQQQHLMGPAVQCGTAETAGVTFPTLDTVVVHAEAAAPTALTVMASAVPLPCSTTTAASGADVPQVQPLPGFHEVSGSGIAAGRLGSAVPSPGLLSPIIGSPSRVGPPSSALGAAACQHVKALTPFAVSLDDPSVCRLSAELMMALPPPMPPLMLSPDTPTPAVHLNVGVDSRAYGSNRGSLRCTGSGDGEDDVPARHSAAMHGGSFSATAMPQLAHTVGSHDVFAAGHVASSSTCMPTAGSVSGVAACAPRAAALGSGGGAVPPLLPPPPPPQVPLCQTTARQESSVSAPAVMASSPVTAAPLLSAPLTHVSGSGCTAPVLSGVHDAVGSATAAVTAAAVAAHSLPLQAPSVTVAAAATAPAWTATFDGVDDPPAAAADKPAPESPGPSVPTLFAVASKEEEPLQVHAAPAAGIATPEARLHTPDMARGMSGEAPEQARSPRF